MNKVFSWKKVIEGLLDETNSYDEFLELSQSKWIHECEGKTKEWIKNNTPYATNDTWFVEKQTTEELDNELAECGFDRAETDEILESISDYFGE